MDFSNVDWGATAQFFANIATVLTLVVAICALRYARTEVSAWKQQMRGQAGYQIAQQLMRSMVLWRNALHSTRNVFAFDDEFQKASEELKRELPEDIMGLDAKGERLAILYSYRFRSVESAKADIEVAVLEANEVHGIDLHQELEMVEDLTFELARAVNKYIELETTPPAERTHDHYVELTESRKIVYSWFKRSRYGKDLEQDDYARRVYELTQQVRKKLEPYLFPE